MGKPEPSKNALDDLPVVNPLEDFDKIPPRDHQSWATPVYQQFWEIQDDVRNRVDSALLFFRLGDFYELFGKDAVVAAPLMEVQLTSRDKKSGSNIPMCGVPAHAWESYAQKILSRGHKVALAEQITEPGDPKHKMVQRALKRIITPGLPCSYQHLDAKQGHWIVCVSKRSTKELSLIHI